MCVCACVCVYVSVSVSVSVWVCVFVVVLCSVVFGVVLYRVNNSLRRTVKSIGKEVRERERE